MHPLSVVVLLFLFVFLMALPLSAAETDNGADAQDTQPAQDKSAVTTEKAGDITADQASEAAEARERAREQARDQEAVTSLAGGKPLPAGQFRYLFKGMQRQHIQATAAADDSLSARVTWQGRKLGVLELDTESGSGSGSFQIDSRQIHSSDQQRDAWWQSAAVLHADRFPKITVTALTLQRLSPTVYRLDGILNMRDQQQAMRVYANVRLLERVPGLGQDILRLKARFGISLKDFGIKAETDLPDRWQVHVMLLGVPQTIKPD